MSLLHLLFMFVGKASLETEKSWLQQEAERWGLHFNLEGKNVGYKFKMFFCGLKEKKKTFNNLCPQSTDYGCCLKIKNVMIVDKDV